MKKEEKCNKKQNCCDKETKKQDSCCSKESKTVEEQEDLLITLKKLQAEFDNYRKQQEKQKALFKVFTKKDLMLKIIPIVDLFDLAIVHTENKEEFVKGVEMIYVQLKDLLNKEGVKEIKEDKFNPEIHEAIMTGDGKEGKILETLQKGYKLDNLIIRPARVKVGNGGKNE